MERRSKIGVNTSSRFSQDVANIWLEQCTRYHERCSRGKSQLHRLPTRLIELQPATGPESTIRLIESATLPTESVYACLSHCWGSSQPLTLTAGSYEEFKTGIRASRLPKTFRETIEVCRWFRIRYLWIDSLCIIQDSKQDWAHEAAQMNLVYKNSHITIAATDGRHPEAGLFRDRIPACVVPPIFEIGDIFPHGVGNKQACVLDMELWVQGVENAPLNKRAWVLQVINPRENKVRCYQLDSGTVTIAPCGTFRSRSVVLGVS